MSETTENIDRNVKLLKQVYAHGLLGHIYVYEWLISEKSKDVHCGEDPNGFKILWTDFKAEMAALAKSTAFSSFLFFF